MGRALRGLGAADCLAGVLGRSGAGKVWFTRIRLLARPCPAVVRFSKVAALAAWAFGLRVLLLTRPLARPFLQVDCGKVFHFADRTNGLCRDHGCCWNVFLLSGFVHLSEARP